MNTLLLIDHCGLQNRKECIRKYVQVKLGYSFRFSLLQFFFLLFTYCNSKTDADYGKDIH
jgi:hypothetical protein